MNMGGPSPCMGQAAKMRAAGQLAAQCLDMIAEVQPGVSTEHLDDLIHQFILIMGPSLPPWAIAAIPNPAAPRSTK